MTKLEWKTRCAARFLEKATWLTQAEADNEAQLCFDAFVDHPFDETADYSPEDCADDALIKWTDDESEEPK